MDKIKVLLVEDEQTLAMIIKDTLEGQNFIIHTAADGEEGLRMFFDLRPDVLVADAEGCFSLKSSFTASLMQAKRATYSLLSTGASNITIRTGV